MASRIDDVRGKTFTGALLVCLWAVLSNPGVVAAAEPPGQQEHEIKAAMLYNFATFVEWPANAMPASGEPLVVGIVGKDPFGKILDEMIAGEQVYGHRIEVRRFPKLSDLEICQLLFVSNSVADRLSEINRVVDSAGVLTVGESQGFSRQGGMIGFIRDGRKIRFEINIGVAQRAGFRISSKLLRVAKVTKGSSP